MHVQTAGMTASRGEPVVVFESGAGTPLSSWSTVLAEVGRFARAVSYDRAGIGLSEFDGRPPTPRNVAESLRRLLAEMDLPPPYVLVGHSWGGPLIRMFAAVFPSDVAGMVYVDPTDLRSEEQDLAYLRASGFSTDGALKHIADQNARMARFVALRIGGYRAEMDVILVNQRSFSSEFRRLPPVPAVPVAVLMSARFDASIWANRPCDPSACHEQWVKSRAEWLRAFVPGGGADAVMVLPDSGHFIQGDDPGAVVAAIRRVLSAVDRPRKENVRDDAARSAAGTNERLLLEPQTLWP
jgi:pimeloyl-ACP methyl ester carboxylesterase